MNEHLKIVRFKSRLWWWDGQQHDGELLLTSLRDSSAGVRAPGNKCRVLEGDEDKRQRDAIAYFLTRK